MNVRVSTEEAAVRIDLEGRFGFEGRRGFARAADEAVAQKPPRVVVDLRRVAYMDSAALGMLLVLRDKAQVAQKSVSIACGPGVVRDILGVANFHRLFEIE